MVNDMIKVPFQTSRYWKGNICLHVQAIGTPLHQGLLVVYFKPFQTNDTRNGKAESIVDAMAGPHVLLYANQSTSACINIPFCVPASFASTIFTLKTDVYNAEISQFLGTLGHINAMVINELNSLSTLTINVSIHAQFKDMVFKVPKNERMNISSVQFQSFLVPALTAIATGALPSAVKFVRDGIDRFSKKFWTWVGLDKPSNPLVLENMRVTTTTNFNNTVGIVPLDRMTMDTSHLSLADSTLFPSEEDEMSMDYILSKQQYITTFTIKNVDPTGRVMFAVPIGPMCFPLTTGATSQIPIITKMATLTKYWRGDIDFHFKVSATDMHTCKLMFARTYGLGAFTNYPDYLDLVNFDCETIEINKGGQEFVVSCPYNSPMPMLNNDLYYGSSYIQHGELIAYLITPLQYPVSAQPYIEISVYVTAGKNFSFYGPCEQSIWYPTTNYNSATLRDIYSKEEIEMFNCVEFQSLTPAIGNLEQSDEGYKEVKSVSNNRMAPIKHLRDIYRRYYLVQSALNGGNVIIRVSDVFRNVKFNSPISMLSNFYDGFRGGIRFRLVMPNIPMNTKIQAYYSFPSFNSNTTTSVALSTTTVSSGNWNYTPAGVPYFVPLLVTFNQADSCLDFEITNENPFMWNKIWNNNPNNIPTDYATDLGYILISFPSAVVGSGFNYKMYASFADESRVGLFMHNGLVTFPSSSAGFNTDIAEFVPDIYKKYYYSA